MANRFGQKNLRRGTGGDTAYDPDAAYDPDTFEERAAETLERHSQKSAADKISDDLSRMLEALEDVEKAMQGDDEAAERVANGDYIPDDGTDDADMVEKAGKAVRKADVPDDFPDLPNEDYSRTAADAVDDEPARVRKSDSVGDLSKAVDDTADRHAESNTRTDDDPATGNPRMVDPDE